MDLNSNTSLSWCPLGSPDEALSDSVGLREARASQTVSGVSDSVTRNSSVDIRGVGLSAPLHEIPAEVVIPAIDSGRLGDRSTATAGTILREGVRVNGRDVVFSTVTSVRQSESPVNPTCTTGLKAFAPAAGPIRSGEFVRLSSAVILTPPMLRS